MNVLEINPYITQLLYQPSRKRDFTIKNHTIKHDNIVHSIPNINIPGTVNYKVVDENIFNLDTKDGCSICLENHIIKDTVVLECRHQYGIKCLENWCRITKTHDITCPLCRSKSNCFTVHILSKC